MSISYFRPPTNPDGTRMSYEQRRAARKALETPRPKPTIMLRPDLTYEQRRALRKAEEQGKREAESLAERQEAARREAAQPPEHLRRPSNVWRDLIEQFRSQSFRPEIKAKIAKYEQLANVRDREIESEMAEKMRRYKVESNPETAKAREHLESASAGADPDEQREFARLRGLIEAGQAGAYWDEVRPILEARLNRIQERVQAGEATLAEQEAAFQATKTEAEEIEKLLG